MNIGERAKITPEFRVNPIAEEVLNKCLALESEFENPPEIQLELLPHTPDGKFIDASSMGVTGAYQCYSPGQPEMKLRHDEKALAVAKSTLQSGHLTTRMFYDMTWRIIGISRSGTHDILHFHPFYNTNQQSQRYVEGKPGEYIIPAGLIKEQRDIFIKAADYANDSYRTLMQALEPEVRQRVNEMYPKKWQNASSTAERLEEKTKKICQEIARYAMPIGQKTTLFYKINEVQLLRMFEQINNMPTEAKYVIAQMISKVVQQDPSILAELPEPLPVRKQEPIPRDLLIEEKQEFDSLFTTPTENSSLVSYPQNAQEHLARVIRHFLGIPKSQMSDEEALMQLLDPALNTSLSSIFDSGMLNETSISRQTALCFATRLSHTADSQRQRHRRTPAATPPIDLQYDGTPDYITPMIIRENPELNSLFQNIMAQMYENVERALSFGIPLEHALLLLPNAHTIRTYETGDFFDWAHRWRQRFCALAQEEIFFITLAQARQTIEIIPEAHYLLQAPCAVAQRAGKGTCTEGHRFCGRKFWELTIEDYPQNRLV